MSFNVTSDAYKTKLGNPTAKAVLALLADKANDDGFCFPSTRHIASMTELSERQVQRIIQVFGVMGLVTRHRIKTEQYNHYLQINLAMLGSDLSKKFKVVFDEYLAKRLTDGDRETETNDRETGKSVSETFPPNPLIGVTIIEPPMNRKAPRLPRKAVATATTILPPWLDRETWDEFRQMRKRVRAPMTPHAEKLLIDRLTPFAFRSKELLERSIVNCWKDIYPDSNNGNQQRAPASVKLIETEFKL